MPSPFDTDTTTLPPYRPDGLIIQFDHGSSAAEHSNALNVIGGRLDAILDPASDTDGDLARVHLGNGITVEKAMALLSHIPGVKFVEPDYSVHTTAVSNDPSVVAGSTWGLYGDVGTTTATTNAFGSHATEAWGLGDVGSTKVAVGVVDTGVDYTHPDLYLNIFLNQGEIPNAFKSQLHDVDGDGRITFRDLNDPSNASFVTDLNGNGYIDAGDLLKDPRWADHTDQDGNGYVDDLVGWDFQHNDNDPMDDAGHGTHVSGTIAAQGGNGVGVSGVGWNTEIVPLKFMDASGGYTSDAIRALNYYQSLAKSNPGVEFVATNNSWAGGSFLQSMQDAIAANAKAGILFVAAAGNSGTNNDTAPQYPANYDTTATAGFNSVVSVASINSNGTLSSFSDYGAKTVDLAAPGGSILSTAMGGGYITMSGTSMATPFVTGAIAVYAAAHPTATAAEIEAALLQSTDADPYLTGKVATGGYLDVYKFVQTVVSMPAPAPAPTPTPTPAPAPAPVPAALNVTVTGTSGNDLITPTSTVAGQNLPGAGTDTLIGNAGNDTLDGGAGADSMDGGAGNDVYYVDNPGDVVTESLSGAAGGVDRVVSSISYTLPTNVENLDLSGSANLNGTGNDLANAINGNSGANVLLGGAGNDTLSGGAGADTLNGGAGADYLVGGSGNDHFVFNKGEAAGDSIQDFKKGDVIELHGYSAGSTFAKVAGSATDWVITDHATGATEIIHLINGAKLGGSDWIFN